MVSSLKELFLGHKGIPLSLIGQSGLEVFALEFKGIKALLNKEVLLVFLAKRNW